MQGQKTMPRNMVGKSLGQPLCFILPILLLFFTGCAAIPGATLPAGIATQPLGKSMADSPLAWSPDSRHLALVRDGLVVINLDDGSRSTLTGEMPSALAWGGDGAQLAAAFTAGEESILRLYGQDGSFREVRLGGQVEDLFWRRPGEILAVAYKIVRYSFGANVAGFMYQWDGSDRPPSPKKLFDATLKLRTLDYLERGGWSFMKADLSPDGHRLVYGQLHDPPVFLPYSSLVLRQLDQGKERLVKDVSLAAARGRFVDDSDQLLVADGQAETFRLDAGTGSVLARWPWPGRTLATTAGAACLLIDGHLLRNAEEVGTFPAETEGWFSPNGEYLAIRRQGRLFLLSGL